MFYSVLLQDANGRYSYLRIKNRTKWKTLRIAKKRAQNIKTLIEKRTNIYNAVNAWVVREEDATTWRD